MRVYLAGPMTGIPYFNAEAFNDAAELLREQGHEVFNPIENSIDHYGATMFYENPQGSVDAAERGYRFDYRATLFDDLQWICTQAEAIALLPEWEKSSGAFAEWSVAKALKLTFIYL